MLNGLCRNCKCCAGFRPVAYKIYGRSRILIEHQRVSGSNFHVLPDGPLVAVVSGLVLLFDEGPDRARRVQVDRPHVEQLAESRRR